MTSIIRLEYSQSEWQQFIQIEKANKREDNLYFGIGIMILCVPGLMFLRGTSFVVALIFSTPFAILIPFLRQKFSYKHLREVKQPWIEIYKDRLLFPNSKVDLESRHKRVKSISKKEVKGVVLLEFVVEWLTRKGPTNDEFRIPVPGNTHSEADRIMQILEAR